MSFSWRLALVCAIALQAATCGQRGPLKLPTPEGKPQSTPAALMEPAGFAALAGALTDVLAQVRAVARP